MHKHNHRLRADGLSWNTEAVLFEQAQTGCRACLNHLMKRHERLVPFVVRRQTLGRLSFVAAVQVGRVGLWRAILGFDAQRGYAFSTYAYPAIARRIWQAVKQIEGANKMVNAIEEISQVVSDNAAATEEGSAATEEQSAAMSEMAHAAQEPATYAETLAENVKKFELGNGL